MATIISERRHSEIPVATERRHPERKRSRFPPDLGHPATSDIEYSPQELEFMRSIDHYKRVMNRPFPTFREVLRIALSLGYRQVEPNDFDSLIRERPIRD